MNDMNETPVENKSPEGAPRSAFTPRLVLGVALILAGVAFTLDNLGFMNAHLLLKLWPLVIILWGLAKLWQEGLRYGGGGLFLVAIGTFFLLVMLGHGNLAESLAPMGLVAFGIWMVMRALQKKRTPAQGPLNSEHYVQGTAIFCGAKRRVVSQAFEGGEFTAIFGGFEADLRGAAAAGNQVRMDVFALFGGGQLKIPESWVVINHATALFGGIDDKTQDDYSKAADPNAPRLVLTGVVLFGGLEIKH
ncbi:MAG: hypothetical protein IPQ13_01975 [Holophagaceae bacterium]|nr:hypothetical protein [Holophagaceae bacterium]